VEIYKGMLLKCTEHEARFGFPVSGLNRACWEDEIIEVLSIKDDTCECLSVTNNRKFNRKFSEIKRAFVESVPKIIKTEVEVAFHAHYCLNRCYAFTEKSSIKSGYCRRYRVMLDITESDIALRCDKCIKEFEL
jgi:hypothetical protein